MANGTQQMAHEPTPAGKDLSDAPMETAAPDTAKPAAPTIGTLSQTGLDSYSVGGTDNSNGGAANTGILTLATSASGQFMVFTDGTLTATGGNVTSGGAARDGACVYGIDTTHWMFLPHSGSWTKH